VHPWGGFDGADTTLIAARSIGATSHWPAASPADLRRGAQMI